MAPDSSIPLLRPLPQRTFRLTNSSSTPSSSREASHPPSPPPAGDAAAGLAAAEPAGTPPRTRSVLNLTASTLFGIYAPGAGAGASESGAGEPGGGAPGSSVASTPGASAPTSPTAGLTRTSSAADDRRPPRAGPYARSPSRRRASAHGPPASAVGALQGTLGGVVRVAALLALGVAYGLLVQRLHDRPAAAAVLGVAPVRVVGWEAGSRAHLALWGVLALVLGYLLPALDALGARRRARGGGGAWASASGEGRVAGEGEKADAGDHADGATASGGDAGRASGRAVGVDWIASVRSVGVFIGVAFAIRRIPWHSTLQASLTLALLNPGLWFLLDGTRAGFALAAAVAIGGTALALRGRPDVVPLPVDAAPTSAAALEGPLTYLTHERVGLWTWIASLLFVSALCFGNVGRWLARGARRG